MKRSDHKDFAIAKAEGGAKNNITKLLILSFRSRKFYLERNKFDGVAHK